MDAGSSDPGGARPAGGSGPPGDAPPLPAGRLLRLGLAFYGGILAVALVWAAAAGDSLLFASPEAAARGVDPWRDPVAGLLAGALAILASRELTRRTAWGEQLARAIGAALGPLSTGHCLLLALASGVAEEALFRGILQPRLGWVAASLLFGLAHLVPRREFLPWTLTSVAAGFGLGALFDATGNLVAPVVAHAFVNAVNLRWLALRYAGRAPGGGPGREPSD